MTAKSLGACAGLFFWLLASTVSAARESQPSSMRHVSISQAPMQVQRDLIRTLAACGASATQVRALASFDVGPIGGPGRKDYFFQSGPGVGDGRVSICAGNYVWQLLWMDVGDARYKMFTRTNNVVFVSPTRSVLFDADSESNCAVRGAGGWWDNGRIWEWNPKAAAFRPITRCMLLKDAQAWAKMRGYQVGEAY